jgi:Zn-dependent protease with chaperone function
MIRVVSVHPERSVRVSTLELFFDLVFVFTITQLSAVLVEGEGVAALVQVVVMLLLIWWIYDGYAWLTNAIMFVRGTSAFGALALGPSPSVRTRRWCSRSRSASDCRRTTSGRSVAACSSTSRKGDLFGEHQRPTFRDQLRFKRAGRSPVEPGTNPELEVVMQDLARRAQAPVRRLYAVPSEQPNAFATGRNPQNAAVAVTEGLLRELPHDRVKSVLAHKFGHIKNRDILVSSIAAIADALETLGRRAQALPLNVSPATASFYIVNPLRRQGVATLFATHPPIAERVRRLRALDDDQILRLVA